MAQKTHSGDMSRPAGWQPHRPHNDLPPLPPAVELETKPVLKQCVTARAALAELKQAAELIPNPAMLINTLPLLEARASSEIENIVTTADQLFRHLQTDSGADPATRASVICSRTGSAFCTRKKRSILWCGWRRRAISRRWYR